MFDARLFDSQARSSAHVNPERTFPYTRSVQMFDLDRCDPYTVRHGTSDQYAAAQHPRVHRAADPRAGLSPVGARDRRCRGPHVTVDGAQPPQHAATTRLPAPRPDQAPSHRGALRHEQRRRHGTPSRPPCPLVGDVAAGTNVLAEENVEELLPVPVDFTGDGELFMLRVRGESMIELGILDGDFVVATQITHPQNGDIVVAGIPGGEATIKTYSRSGADVTLDSGERHDGTDDLHRRPGRDLRQGRHRDAPLLSGGHHVPAGPSGSARPRVAEEAAAATTRAAAGAASSATPRRRTRRSSAAGPGIPAGSPAIRARARSAPTWRPVREPARSRRRPVTSSRMPITRPTTNGCERAEAHQRHAVVRVAADADVEAGSRRTRHAAGGRRPVRSSTVPIDDPCDPPAS